MKIISFSLWGNELKYSFGAIKNAKLAQHVFPNWFCRFYIDSTVPLPIIKELDKLKNTQIVLMKKPGNWSSAFWRLKPAFEDDVEILLSRDTDSRLNSREKDAIDEWLSSDKLVHIMRDHPSHGKAILAGTCGFKGSVLNNFKEIIEEYKKKKGCYHQVDQDFLCDVVYPNVKENTYVHDEFFGKKPFPTQRNGLEFIGQSFDEHDNYDQNQVEILRNYFYNINPSSGNIQENYESTNFNYRLISPGGCGTVAFEILLTDILDKKHWNTHKRYPNLDLFSRRLKITKPIRVFYLYGDPCNTILSYFRRGFLKYPYDHCKYLGGNLTGLMKKDEWTLEEYLDNGVDFFKLRAHFEGWLNFSKRNYEILFFKYEYTEKYMNVIADWFELEKSKVDKFKFKKRSSDWRSQPKNIQDGLKRIYGDYLEFLDSMKSFFVLKSE